MTGSVPRTMTQAFLGLVLASAAAALSAGDPGLVATGPDNKVAIKGYDTVAYFTEGKARKGKTEFSASWNNAEWHFASPDHRDLFAADPERYVPQFGGFCARGIIKGKRVAADPEAWTIVDGKLYIKFNETVRDDWRKSPAENIQKAEEKWVRFE